MSRRDLVFEIGVEEIPSAALYNAIAQLKELATKSLDDARLEYAEVRTYGAPRRLVLVVDGLAEVQADQHLRIKGPSAKAAFDADLEQQVAGGGHAAPPSVTGASCMGTCSPSLQDV